MKASMVKALMFCCACAAFTGLGVSFGPFPEAYAQGRNQAAAPPPPSGTSTAEQEFQNKPQSQAAEAQKQLRQVEICYQSGISTAQDVTQAMLALVKARFAAANALLAPSATDAEVRQAKEQLTRVKAGYLAKRNTLPELDRARIALMDACCRRVSPSSVDTSDTVLQNLELADAQQGDKLWLATRAFQTGIGSTEEIQQADAAKSDAQSRLYLHQVVALAQRYVLRLRAAEKQGAASQQEAAKAALVLEEAQSRQSQLGGNPGPAMLALDVSLAQENLTRFQTGFQHGTNTKMDVDTAASALQYAQDRLAQAQEHNH